MNALRSWHHVPVKPGRVVPRSLLAVVLGLAVLSAGCGGSEDTPQAKASKTPTPTPSVNVPDGVTLTKNGTDLDFGQPATVAYEPNPQKATVLELTVNSVKQGTIADFSNYVLDDATKASTPYYVRVSVKNVGDGDVGQTPIPLLAVDGSNTLIQASSFTNAFPSCPSKALPASFAPAASTTTCLVYLVPDHGELTGVSFRPLQAFAPILWTGTIDPPPTPAKKKKAS